MVYQIKRRKRRTQELELVDENGLIQRKIVVELDTDTMMKRVMEAYRDLCSAQRLFQNAEQRTELTLNSWSGWDWL